MTSGSLPDLPDLPAAARLRSGTAARLAGLPATTLRVWERRYQVVAAPRSASGQRLYGPQDVQRLALLRRLTGRGHGIGTIAQLPLDALRALDGAEPPAGATVAVIGTALARRLAPVPGAPPVLATTLDGAESARPERPVFAVLAQMDALQATEAERLLALARRLSVPLTVVYRFGADAVVALLKARGATVHREPVDLQELARGLAAQSPAAAAPRRFSDDELAGLSALPTKVLCECPRHLAELVAQLAAFEQYSAGCQVRHPDDAALHRRLLALAATARAQFEQALADVMAAEGLTPSAARDADGAG
jgi:DNA-binding transcriptional MerR regulator